MATIQVNPPGLTTTSEGYISSVTIYSAGSATVFTPSTVVDSTYGQITGVGALATTELVQNNTRFKLVTG